MPREGEVVALRGGGDEAFDFGEGVRGDDVDGLEFFDERRGSGDRDRGGEVGV